MLQAYRLHVAERAALGTAYRYPNFDRIDAFAVATAEAVGA